MVPLVGGAVRVSFASAMKGNGGKRLWGGGYRSYVPQKDTVSK